MQQLPKHILILDSDETILIELERVLEDAGFRTTLPGTLSMSPNDWTKANSTC